MSATNGANRNRFDAAAAFRAEEAAGEQEHWDSQKQKDFIDRGITNMVTGEKVLITALPVGKVTGEKLKDHGFYYVHQLIGQYMVNSMDDEATSHWLENEIGIKRPDLRELLIGMMRKWCDRHV